MCRGAWNYRRTQHRCSLRVPPAGTVERLAYLLATGTFLAAACLLAGTLPVTDLTAALLAGPGALACLSGAADFACLTAGIALTGLVLLACLTGVALLAGGALFAAAVGLALVCTAGAACLTGRAGDTAFLVG